jgi:putative FmdB family regulatory protein
LYAYRCTQCGHRFEKIQNFSAEPEAVCPQCGGVLERPLTAPRLHFKGAGWYINDYAAKSSAPDSDSGAKSDAAKSGQKSESGAAAGETKKSSTASEGSGSAPAATPAPAPSATPGSTS